jgi:two-component system alkaline phosphatase synthesis response regulator PhoP
MKDGKIVLVVDDEENIVSVIKDRLEANKFKVITACNGQEAVQKASERPDIIIMDIVMPVMDGVEALRALKANEATMDIPVLILTVKGDSTIQKQVSALGAADIMEKPFHPAELAAKVNFLLNE